MHLSNEVVLRPRFKFELKRSNEEALKLFEDSKETNALKSGLILSLLNPINSNLDKYEIAYNTSFIINISLSSYVFIRTI